MSKNSLLENKRLVSYLIIAITVCVYTLSLYSIGSIIIFGLALLIYIIYLYGNGKKIDIKLNVLQWVTLLFGVYCFVSSYWAMYDKKLAQTKGITILEMFIFICLLYKPMQEYYEMDELIHFQKISGYIVVVWAFFNYRIGAIISAITGGERLDNTFINSNVLGMMSSTTILYIVYEVYLRKKITVSDVMFIPCLILVAASGSRKALVSLVIGCIALCAMLNHEANIVKRFAKYILGGILFLIVAFVIAKSNIFEGLNERMLKMFNMFSGDGNVDRSSLMRQQMISIGMEQFKKTPVFGIGIDNPRFLVQPYFNKAYYLHNNYVELLTGVGIVGFILYYSLYLYLIVNLIKNKKNSTNSYYLIVVLLILRLVMDYGAVSYYSKETYINLMILFIQLDKIQKISPNNK